MRQSNLLRSILILLISVSLFSCDREEMIETQENLVFEKDEITNNRGSEYKEFSLLIEWHQHVDEQRKEVVRDYYKSKKVLLSYYICEDEKFETWSVPKRDSDTPVDTDDDVKRISVDTTCETEE